MGIEKNESIEQSDDTYIKHEAGVNELGQYILKITASKAIVDKIKDAASSVNVFNRSMVSTILHDFIYRDLNNKKAEEGLECLLTYHQLISEVFDRITKELMAKKKSKDDDDDDDYTKTYL